MSVSIQTVGGIIQVRCPYSAPLIERFKSLRGKWAKPFWQFTNDPATVAELQALWGDWTDQSMASYTGADLVASSGQLLLGGYVIAATAYGKVEIVDGVTVGLSGSAVGVGADGQLVADPSWNISLDVGRGFSPSLAHLVFLPAPPPLQRGRKRPAAKPAAKPAPASATPAPPAAPPVPTPPDWMATKSKYEHALTCTLNMLENGGIPARDVQGLIREAMGWSDGSAMEIATVTFRGKGAAYGAFHDGPPEPSAADGQAEADPFAKLRQMFG